jgi:putative protease
MSGFGTKANPYNLEEMLELADEVKSYGKSIFVTVNGAAYNQAELNKLNEYFHIFAERGIDGVIVSTPELTVMAKEAGVEPVASTMCGIFSSDTVSFYKKLGMKRMILPRDLSMAEIESIVKAHPDVSYEVFLMRNGCQFSDSHCLGFHRNKGSVCGMLNMSKFQICSDGEDFESRHNTELNHMLYTGCFHRAAACGLCALYRFAKLGISSYKIVGRSEQADGIIKDVLMIKKNLEIATACSSEAEYLEKMALPENSLVACKMGLSCYYPEIRF